MKDTIIRFDVFRKMPKDLTEPTFCGALVSFVCTFILVMLVFSEFQAYWQVETKSDMLVDITHHDDNLNINLDIVFPKMPCDVLSLDVQDIMGSHMGDVRGNLQKKRLSQDGTVLSVSSVLEGMQARSQLTQTVKDEIAQKQGCQLQGFF